MPFLYFGYKLNNQQAKFDKKISLPIFFFFFSENELNPFRDALHRLNVRNKRYAITLSVKWGKKFLELNIHRKRKGRGINMQYWFNWCACGLNNDQWNLCKIHQGHDSFSKYVVIWICHYITSSYLEMKTNGK